MAHQGPGQTALLLPTLTSPERIIFVQSRPRVDTIRTVSDLFTDLLVPRVASPAARSFATVSFPSQSRFSHIFNAATQQITLTHMPFMPQAELSTHFTILFSPQSGPNPAPRKNTVLQTFVGSDQVTWMGNLLVVAHTPEGEPVLFTHDHMNVARILLTR